MPNYQAGPCRVLYPRFAVMQQATKQSRHGWYPCVPGNMDALILRCPMPDERDCRHHAGNDPLQDNATLTAVTDMCQALWSCIGRIGPQACTISYGLRTRSSRQAQRLLIFEFWGYSIGRLPDDVCQGAPVDDPPAPLRMLVQGDAVSLHFLAFLVSDVPPQSGLRAMLVPRRCPALAQTERWNTLIPSRQPS